MLGWIAVLMIAGFLTGCGVIIGASCYQVIKRVKNTPKQSKHFTGIIEA
jgi:hypothetical protein